MRRELVARFLGKDIGINYSDKSVVYSILSLRIVMAWVFLQSGVQKLLDPTWTAGGFLGGISETNPFTGLWTLMAGAPAVDPLVVYGQIFIGLGLLFGAFFRFSALMGGLQMLLFWMASLEAGLLAGLPVAHGYVISQHIVYALILFGLGAFNAGRIYGVDNYLEETELVRKVPQLRYLLG